MRSGYIVLSLLLACALDASTATFVVGTTAGVAAAVAVAVGAAAVLGLGALGVGAAVAASRGRGGRGRRFRGRRDVTAAEELADEEEDSNMWDMVSTNDQAGCARKLICLLEAAEGKVDQDEQVVLAFLGDLKQLAKTPSAAKVPYGTAGWLGRLRGAKACEAAFGESCPYSRENMMAVIKTIWSSALPAVAEV